MSDEPRLLLAGAFDRFNFGDLLFPRVARAALERLGVRRPVDHYATVAAELTDRGGVTARALAQLRRRPAPAGSWLVVCGGEVLQARWHHSWGALTSPFTSLLLKLAARAGAAGLADRAARRALGDPRPQPWILAPEDVGPESRIAYTGVGGSGLDALPRRLADEARRRLRRAAYLSVRDRRTLEHLTGWGGWSSSSPPRLAPDPAVLISELLPRRQLLRQLSGPTAQLLASFAGGYVVFQAGRYPLRGHLAATADALRELHRITGLPTVLLPLGQAAGHEDEVPLRHLAETLRGLPVTLAAASTVPDILGLIAHARLFLGTSLHGNLTALTYEVPRVGLNPAVTKLDAFLRTWDDTQPEGCAMPADIAARGAAALALPPNRLAANRQRLIEASWADFRRLYAALTADADGGR